MIKWIVSAGIAAALLSVTACSAGHATLSAPSSPAAQVQTTSGSYTADEPTPAPVYATPSVPAGDPDAIASQLIYTSSGQSLISTARPQISRYYQRGGDYALVKLGVTLCQAFDRGVSYTTLAAIGPQNGFTATETGAIIGSSVGALCPAHMADLHL